MVDVRHMRMRVPRLLMPMLVRVAYGLRHPVRVLMMSVIMGVRMVVNQQLMEMIVLVFLV